MYADAVLSMREKEERDSGKKGSDNVKKHRHSFIFAILLLILVKDCCIVSRRLIWKDRALLVYKGDKIVCNKYKFVA